MIFLLFITKLLINWIPSYYFQTKYYNFKIPDFTYIYRKKNGIKKVLIYNIGSQALCVTYSFSSPS